MCSGGGTAKPTNPSTPAPAPGASPPGGCAPGTAPGGATKPCDDIVVVQLHEVLPAGGAAPTQPAVGRKQYINLDDQVEPGTPHPEYGRFITLKAKIAWAAGDPARPLSGKTVYFYAVPGAGNRAGLTGDLQPGFESAGSNKLKLPVQTTTADGWTGEVKFYMSRYGGDTFDIFVTTDSGYAGGKNTGTYTVWKKIWYGRIDMAKATPPDKFEVPDGSIAIAVAAYEKVFIELTDSSERQTGTYKENFDVHTDGYAWADNYTTNKFAPFKVVYSAVDVLCPIANRQTLTVSQNVTSAKETIALPTSFYPFDFNGGNWLVSVTATGTGPTGAVAATPVVNLPSGRRNDNLGLEVDFTGTALTPTAAAPAAVSITYYDAPGYNGWGGANLHLVICRGIMEPAYGANMVAAMGGTSTHEPGHALGLVRSPLAWETPDASHRTHCKVQKCVMWFQGYTGRPSDFHTVLDDGTAEDPNCHTFLREKDMSRAKMTIWKFPR